MSGSSSASPATKPALPPALSLTLADGSTWQIMAGHEEAGPVVQALGQAMRLQPGTGVGRPLVVVLRGHHPAVPVPTHAGPPVICDVGGGDDPSPDLLFIYMSRAVLPIARDVQPRGGALLHGALAEWHGQGLLLAGPGDVGKSTASRRLALPFVSICDDAALVVRDSRGQYWAHPWPTWSLFYADGPGGSWDVQQALPLSAIFLLHQSQEDRAEPVGPAQAIAALSESVAQVAGPMRFVLSDGDQRNMRQEWLSAVEEIAGAIPVHRLFISLGGRFWEELEGVMASLPQPAALPEPARAVPPGLAMKTEPGVRPGALHVVYTGPSMNPTLRQPDLLTVVPYGSSPVRRGDVIYFRSPADDHDVVHRVVGTGAQGLRTRGDNNSDLDPYALAPEDVYGRVVAARDGRGERPIAGGRVGLLVRLAVALRRKVYFLAARALHGLYHGLADRAWLSRLLPRGLRPRAYAFSTRHRIVVRWVIGRREVGRYDTVWRRWRIRLPFRLMLDPARLRQVERWVEATKPQRVP